MSAFYQAQTRLEQALKRLETALQDRGDGSERENLMLAEVRGLREECEQLRGRLDGSNKRYARMQSIVSEVSDRLDKTIAELDGILEP